MAKQVEFYSISGIEIPLNLPKESRAEIKRIFHYRDDITVIGMPSFYFAGGLVRLKKEEVKSLEKLGIEYVSGVCEGLSRDRISIRDILRRKISQEQILAVE